MSLRHPLLSRWASYPAGILQSAPISKSSPLSAPRSLFMRHNQPAGSSPFSSASFRRTFSLGRSFQFQQGRSLSRMKSTTTRPRIEPIKPPRHQQKHQQQQQRRFSSSRQNTESLSHKLRKLSREYGWSALGVYLLLSAIDFPFCYAAVRLLGADRIGHYEDVILQTAGNAIRAVWPGKQAGDSNNLEEAVEGNKEGSAEQSPEEAGKAVAKKRVDEASMCYTDIFNLGRQFIADLSYSRHMDSAGPRLCHSQESHLHPGALDRSYHAQGGQGPESLGR